MKLLSRRKLITGSAASIAYAALPKQARAASGVIAGAIRFDPWYQTSGTVDDLAKSNAIQNMMAPPRWNFRAPWFCLPVNNQISCNASQANMDTEIQCAANAGVKFWAYNEFLPNSSFRVAWNLHQSSSIKSSVDWCWISGLAFLGTTMNFSTQVAGYVANYQQANYQKVLSGRPLHFLFWAAANFIGSWGGSNPATGYTNLAAMITALRSASVSAGAGNPYIVVMDFGAIAATEATNIGADAISFYNTSSFGNFSNLSTACQAAWTTQLAAASGASLGFIPTSVTGWDRSPIQESPNALVGGNPTVPALAPIPLVGMLEMSSPGTPANIATLASACVTLVKANPTPCASTVMLMTAWDENAEEGGAMQPSIGDPPQVGNTNNILTALAPVLN